MGTDAMNKEYIQEYRRLKQAGLGVSRQPAIRFNAGGESETVGHFVAKAIAGKVCLQNGYQIDTEVAGPTGEIDLLAYAPDRITYAIELETDPDSDSKQQYRTQYVDPYEPIQDIQLIDVGSLPAHALDMRDRIVTELGFY